MSGVDRVNRHAVLLPDGKRHRRETDQAEAAPQR